MKMHGYFLESRLTYKEKDNLYNDCIGCLNRICVTDEKEEVLKNACKVLALMIL